MFTTFTLAAILAVAAAEPPGPVGEGMAARIAPFLGDEVGGVARLDLEKWDSREFARSVLGKLADEPGVAGMVAMVEGRLAGLKAAGAKELFVQIDLADIPGFPVLVVPLAGVKDTQALGSAITGPGPFPWPATETIRGALVAGTPESLARVGKLKAGDRPDLASSLAEGGESPLRLAILPTALQRRALDESMTNLPPELGGGPITTVTRGLNWASLAVRAGPKPSLRFVVKGRDEAATQALREVLRHGLDLVATQGAKNPVMADLTQAVGRLSPNVAGDRVTLEVNLADVASLMAAPVRQANEASRRTRSINNLKQIGLAMHNYHSTRNSFPPAFLASKEGKPLLSWRVQILPFLDEQKLYDEFHQDEPWDSPHNKALISRMPEVYACPDEAPSLVKDGKTTYLTPRGPHSIFPGAEGVKIQQITDGTSMTVCTLDANDAAAVTWTRPDDWEVGDEPKMDALLGHHSAGIVVGFADGSVRTIKASLAPRLLKAVLTRDGGEVLNSDDF